jgi:hypothetical protein
MPCAAPARGVRQTPPHTSSLAFNDAIDSNPCGKPALLTVNAVSVSAENLCQFHWILAHGYRDLILPVTKEA